MMLQCKGFLFTEVLIDVSEGAGVFALLEMTAKFLVAKSELSLFKKRLGCNKKGMIYFTP